jgi:hypothetical protein
VLFSFLALPNDAKSEKNRVTYEVLSKQINAVSSLYLVVSVLMCRTIDWILLLGFHDILAHQDQDDDRSLPQRLQVNRRYLVDQLREFCTPASMMSWFYRLTKNRL